MSAPFTTRLPRATRRNSLIVSALVASGLLAGCGGGGDGDFDLNVKPSFAGTITKMTYDGTSDDLLTGGLGKSGLQGTAPTIANPTAPTAAELRRLALYINYRALVDVNKPTGGYGTLYGPNIDVKGNDTLGEGKIAGTEYLAYADDGTGKLNVTLMVQVPNSFSKDKACIVTAASSGSRGVYGAIGTAGEWGLKHGCAVAYIDKGTGMGVHDLAGNTVNLQNGLRADAASAGKSSNFTAALTAAELASFNAAFPNRIAFKHAFSQQNPEKDWGRNTLDAVRLAFFVLNEQFSDKFNNGSSKVQIKPDNTIVIASSVSNGGAAAIAAAEQDTEGLIDGVAVGEPVLELLPNPALTVRRGTTSLVGGARPLYDYYSLANLYRPCLSLSARAAGSHGVAAVLPVPAIAANRCAALKARGLLTKTTLAEQADESLDILIAAGWQPESNLNHGVEWTQGTIAVLTGYAFAYGRFSVNDNLCGLSYAGVDAAGQPAPLSATALAQIFGTGNGVPPISGVQIINNNSVGGPINHLISVSPSTGLQDYNIDGAVCLRNLWTGTDANAVRVQTGVKETVRSANLRGKPAIIVAGRSDGHVPVNFNERPYFGQNKIVEGSASKLSYIEVLNAQHFDAFIDNAAVPGFDVAYVPLHYYFIMAMDKVYANLTQSAPLPPSQVVRATPRGGTPG
ncbi:MAG: 3-hydroxybutyrate oligomer hydrolase family protein, partial [Betaproteobacteria bacterium]